MTILTVVGARPQFIKAAVLSRLARSLAYADRVREVLVHTGQHYDQNMSEVFFREMRIPEPDLNLGLGGGSHGKMTGEMLIRLEEILLAQRPDLVLVYGDTNSTLSGALAASKLHLPVAHVEAGLRSFDKDMPEEQNRVLTDHLSTWLFCPSDVAVSNLKREGIVDVGGSAAASHGPSPDAPTVRAVGDIMLDASLFYRNIASARPKAERILPRLGLEPGFRLLTLHRAENTDDPSRLAAITDALNRANDRPIVFPVHPRTRKFLAEYGLALAGHIKAIDPIGYLDMLELEEACSCVLTDSGGVQKEAYFFGKPCVTLRDSTEWIETVRTGWNRLAGAEPEVILSAIAASGVGGDPGLALYGNGHAGERILETIAERE
jgi:UDP-GlcNAc3NAcA epimerase